MASVTMSTHVLENLTCGICSVRGIYDCGCSDIPAGDCDNGNQLDALGECGGPCEADADADGICGRRPMCWRARRLRCVQRTGRDHECGCADIPEGDCDCDGNVLDECGICGGDGIPAGDCDCDGNSDASENVEGLVRPMRTRWHLRRRRPTCWRA